MKAKHIIPVLVILILTSSVASAGFFSDLLSLITGKSVAQDGFYVEFDQLFNLESDVCNGEEKTYIVKSYGAELIELAGKGVKTKEVYITKGGCKGVYYKDLTTGKTIPLKAIGTDMIIGNRYYALKLVSDVDLSQVYGSGYSRVETAVLSAEDRSMQLENGLSKTMAVYLHEAGTNKNIVYKDESGLLVVAPSTKEKLNFDMSPTLVPKRMPEKPAAKAAPKTEAPSQWDEQRVAAVESQLATLNTKVDQLAVSVQSLSKGEKKGFWSKAFRG